MKTSLNLRDMQKLVDKPFAALQILKFQIRMYI